MKLIFELSGENPTIPLAELACIGKVTDHREQVAIADCENPGSLNRLAMTRAVYEYFGECSPDFSSFSDLLSDLALKADTPFRGRVTKVHSGDTRAVDACSQRDFERLIGTKIDGTVDLSEPALEFRAILSEDRCYFGRLLMAIDRGAYGHRKPKTRAFFHPGVMMPLLARALVNISCAEPGEILFDPFCGTGGILIEAEMLDINAIGGDFDPFMVHGSRRNVRNASFIIADGTRTPLCDASVEAIVTDFPYGQSVAIRREGTMERLYDNALSEIGRVLRPGRRAVIVTHRDITRIAENHMEILEKHEQRVHKSLTRRILVLTSA
ncbi:MAG: tRNA (guanine(10)-N2)-dimethyltransferase [Methanoregula sp. PtaU1.Bin051]|nr:MAG: tRNA (guanine(10)-N2)-dimethyltransferase [Methanoregula sp. PtaU1.Bin051]